MGGAGGIEEVFARSVNGGRTPYRWLARAVASSATLVLDVASGAGAMSRALHRPDRVVIGLDTSRTELELAAGRSAGPWVQADALALPFADNSFDAITSSMALAVIQPSSTLLGECARVLKPGGVFAGLLPSSWPAAPSDIRLAAQLSWVLKSVLRFPGDLAIGFASAAAGAGLTKAEDARERYRYPIRSHADAERLMNALDLTGVPPERVGEAIDFLGERVIASGEINLAIPLRRVVAIK